MAATIWTCCHGKRKTVLTWGAGLQKVELKATQILHLGPCDNSAGQYPFAKKKQSLEFLREKAHLRVRTNTIAAIARIRNALAFATHEFFQSHGFVYVHTPVITCSDCEGAGELFQASIAPPLPPFCLFTHRCTLRRSLHQSCMAGELGKESLDQKGTKLKP